MNDDLIFIGSAYKRKKQPEAIQEQPEYQVGIEPVHRDAILEYDPGNEK